MANKVNDMHRDIKHAGKDIKILAKSWCVSRDQAQGLYWTPIGHPFLARDAAQAKIFHGQDDLVESIAQ